MQRLWVEKIRERSALKDQREWQDLYDVLAGLGDYFAVPQLQANVIARVVQIIAEIDASVADDVTASPEDIATAQLIRGQVAQILVLLYNHRFRASGLLRLNRLLSAWYA